MDIYPVADHSPSRKNDNSIGCLNKYGTLCLIDEIQMQKELFLSQFNQTKEQAWTQLQNNLEKRGVQRVTDTNCKLTWRNLLEKYFEWKENHKSNTSLHAFFEKMKFIEGTEKKDWKTEELVYDQNVNIVKFDGPGLLKLPQSLQFTYALIDAIKKVNGIRHENKYPDFSGKLVSQTAIKQNMLDAGFEKIEVEDIVDTWNRLLEIHELGKKAESQLKSDIMRKLYQNLSFIDREKSIPVPNDPKTAEITEASNKDEPTSEPVAPEEEFGKLYWFYFTLIVVVVFPIIFAIRLRK